MKIKLKLWNKYFLTTFSYTGMVFLIWIKPILPQVSLWSEGYNIYQERLYENTLIQIMVDEKFVITVNKTWEDNKNLKYNFTPDTNYLNFLKPSEQSKNNNQKSKIKYQIKDKLKFNIAGILGTPNDGSILFPVEARKTINIDNKPFVMLITGLIDPAYVEDNTIASHYIGNFNLTIQSKPPVETDNTLNLSPPPEANPNSAPGEENITSIGNISDADKQRYLLQYLREMVNILNQ